MTESTCASGVELLMDYLEGAVSDDVRDAIESHVSGCPRCVAFLESDRATPQVLREATTVEMPRDLQDSLITAIRAARREGS